MLTYMISFLFFAHSNVCTRSSFPPHTDPLIPLQFPQFPEPAFALQSFAYHLQNQHLYQNIAFWMALHAVNCLKQEQLQPISKLEKLKKMLKPHIFVSIWLSSSYRATLTVMPQIFGKQRNTFAWNNKSPRWPHLGLLIQGSNADYPPDGPSCPQTHSTPQWGTSACASTHGCNL